MESIFEKMNEEEVTKILAISESVDFTPGSIIYKQEAVSDSVYIIKEGTVSLVKINDIGDDVEITQVEKGSFLGEISTLDERERALTAIAVSDVKLFKISKEKLSLMMKLDYRVLIKFYLTLIRDINATLRRINDEYSKIKEKLTKS